MSPTRQSYSSTVEEALRILGEERRRIGREAMPCIEHPGADPRLADAAQRLVNILYKEGDLGPHYLSPYILMHKAESLAGCLQACYEAWQIENGS